MADLLEHNFTRPIQRVEFFTRFWATLLDFVIYITLNFILLLLFSTNDFSFDNFRDQIMQRGIGGDEEQYITFILGGIIVLVEFFTGLTFAKLILGLRVGDLKGRPAPMKNLMVRGSFTLSSHIFQILGAYLFFPISFVSTIVSLVWFLGCFVAFTDQRQALHDLLGGTAVYRKDEMESDE